VNSKTLLVLLNHDLSDKVS